MPPKRSRQLVLLGEHQANLDNRVIKYRLKQSCRIHGIRLEIRNDTGLTIVVPRKFSQDQVDNLLKVKSSWILRHLTGQNPVQIPLFYKEVDHGEKIPYMGRKVELIIRDIGSGAVLIELAGDRLYVNLDGRRKSIAGLLKNWYRNQAGHIFRLKADIFKQPMGLNCKNILIRNQKTRWGSCSPAGNISLNWKLLLAPEAVIDYVIIHELAHLKYMNHSKKFWDFVGFHCPAWKKHRKWLNAHEHDLKSAATFGAVS